MDHLPFMTTLSVVAKNAGLPRPLTILPSHLPLSRHVVTLGIVFELVIAMPRSTKIPAPGSLRSG
jgi:hypothetical protein